MTHLTQVELRLLRVLLVKPLSQQEMWYAMLPFPAGDINDILRHLSQQYLITKQDVMMGHTCSRGTPYLWRLTFFGRQAIQTGSHE